VTRGTTGRWSRRVGAGVLATAAILAIAAPAVAPYAPNEQFDDRAYAPPTRVRIFGPEGFTRPFIHPLVLEDRLAGRYREDRSVMVPIRWFSRGRLVSTGSASVPLMLLGGDAVGRDVFSRLLFGARLSLGVTFLGVIGALGIGAMMGGLAGTMGGRVDGALMVVADFLLAVPGAYLVLVLRGVLEQVLETWQIFGLIAALFAVAGWPHTARGVRAIVASERTREYAEAARAAGAGPWRLARQLLPAARGFLAVEVLLLVPALLVAEATISYLGLGFSSAQASWGTMMQDATANGYVLARAPWLLAPAAGVFVVALATQMMGFNRTPPLPGFIRPPRPS